MKNNKIKKITTIVLAVMLGISLCGVVVHEINSYRAKKANDKAAEMVDILSVLSSEIENEPETELESESETEPESEADTELESVPETAPETETEAENEPESIEDEVAQKFLKVDISSVMEVNEDIWGWIIIPDTTVNYPLLQGDDNNHYLNYSWDDQWNPAGSIFLDYRNAQDFSDFHSIIYGHRMYDDSMFNSLKYYDDEAYLEEHPYVYIMNGEGVLRFTVFSAYTASTDGPSWRLGLKKTEDQQLLIDYFIQESEIDAGFRPLAENGDRILTLSTCSQAGDSASRWVVHAVLSSVLPNNVINR